MSGVILPFPFAFMALTETNLAETPFSCFLQLLPIMNMVLPDLARPNRLTGTIQAD